MTEKTMNTVSYVGAAASAASAITLTELGIIIGIATALLTFLAAQIWQARRDGREAAIQQAGEKRAERLYELEIERICGLNITPGAMPSCDTDER